MEQWAVWKIDSRKLQRKFRAFRKQHVFTKMPRQKTISCVANNVSVFLCLSCPLMQLRLRSRCLVSTHHHCFIKHVNRYAHYSLLFGLSLNNPSANVDVPSIYLTFIQLKRTLCCTLAQNVKSASSAIYGFNFALLSNTTVYLTGFLAGALDKAPGHAGLRNKYSQRHSTRRSAFIATVLVRTDVAARYC